jgi:hypothetical protein
MMEVEQYYVRDESGGKPESCLHYPLKSRRHIPIIPKAISVARIVILSYSVQAKS